LVKIIGFLIYIGKEHMRIFLTVFIIFLSVTLLSSDGSIRNIEKVFPERIGSLKLVECSDFEKKTPGLGYGISYRTPGMSADIYAYDFRMKDIPEGAESEMMKKHFEQVAAEIYQIEKAGKYRNVKPAGTVEGRKLSGIGFLYRGFTLEREGAAMESRIYLTGYKGKFFKIRITYEASSELNLSGEADAFADKIFEILGKKPENTGGNQ